MSCDDTYMFSLVTMFAICGSRVVLIHYFRIVYNVTFTALIRITWHRMLLARFQMMHIMSRARCLPLALLFLHVTLHAACAARAYLRAYVLCLNRLHSRFAGEHRHSDDIPQRSSAGRNACMLCAWSCFLVLAPVHLWCSTVSRLATEDRLWIFFYK